MTSQNLPKSLPFPFSPHFRGFVRSSDTVWKVAHIPRQRVSSGAVNFAVILVYDQYGSSRLPCWCLPCVPYTESNGRNQTVHLPNQTENHHSHAWRRAGYCRQIHYAINRFVWWKTVSLGSNQYRWLICWHSKHIIRKQRSCAGIRSLALSLNFSSYTCPLTSTQSRLAHINCKRIKQCALFVQVRICSFLFLLNLVFFADLAGPLYWTWIHLCKGTCAFSVCCVLSAHKFNSWSTKPTVVELFDKCNPWVILIPTVIPIGRPALMIFKHLKVS